MKHRPVRLVLAALVLLAATAPLRALETAEAARSPRQNSRAAAPQAGAASATGPRRAVDQRPEAATVLLVDDDWDYDFTNPGSEGGLPYYTSAMDLVGVSWSIWDVQALGQPGAAALEGYEAVIWFTGYAYGAFEQDPGVFTPGNEAAVASYLDGGGNLILSSQEYYFDCCDNGNLTNFMKHYLGLQDILDDVTATAAAGLPGDPIGDGTGPYPMARPDDYGVYWPTGKNEGPYDDEVYALPAAGTPFVYASPWNTGFSATRFEGVGFRTLYLGWPLEWIDTANERAQILGRALWWMGVNLPALVAPVVEPIDNADGNAEYLIDWDDVAGATEYLVEEDEDPAFGSAVNRYQGPSSQVEITQQELGTWYYRVQARNPGESSGWSSTGSATVWNPAPAAPVLAAIDNPTHSNSFWITWSDVDGAISYTLEGDEYASFYSPEVEYSGGESSAQVTNHPGGTWYFRVRVATEGGTSPWSNVEPVDIVPLPPDLRSIFNPDGNGSYWVTWEASAGAETYTLEEDDNPDFSSPTELYTGMGRVHQVDGQPVGAWYYRVLASNGFGSGSWSNVRSTGVFSGAPVLLPIDDGDGDGSYLVAWGSVAGATGYRLEEDSETSFASPTVRCEGADRQYTMEGQLRGTWYYRVIAYNEGGVSPASNVESVSLPGMYLPLILRSR